MKKLLFTAALVALSSSLALADDKTEFKFNGELRERYVLSNNTSFISSGAVNESHFEQRAKFGLNASTSDKLQAYLGFLNATVWGAGTPISGGSGTAVGGTPYGTGAGLSTASPTIHNTALIHEAWLWWKVSDIFSVKAGRSGHEMGDGIIVAKNDWTAVPLVFDGLMGRFSWDFLDLDLGAAKLVDSGVAAANTPSAGGITNNGDNTDREIVAWILSGSFKNLPDVLKAVDLFATQVNGDAGASGGTFAPAVSTGATAGAWNLMTYGLHLKGEVSMIDFRVDGAFQSGKQKSTATGTADMTYAGSMYDLEVGANFPEFMKARVFVSYHTDTGDDSASADKYEGYQPLFYDNHKYSSAMNIFGFGNLTAINVGASLKPAEDTEVGIDYGMFTRTSDKAVPTTVSADRNFFTVPAFSGATANPSIIASTNTEKGLGTEIDLWASHSYGHGLTMMAHVGFFTLGNYFKPALMQGVGTSAMQFLAQAKYNF